jgi:uridine kinase
VSEDLKTFVVSPEGLDILRKIDGDIGIVAVSGAQRTGKSFILNLLLDKLGGTGVILMHVNHYVLTIVQNISLN